MPIPAEGWPTSPPQTWGRRLSDPLLSGSPEELAPRHTPKPRWLRRAKKGGEGGGIYMRWAALGPSKLRFAFATLQWTLSCLTSCVCCAALQAILGEVTNNSRRHSEHTVVPCGLSLADFGLRLADFGPTSGVFGPNAVDRPEFGQTRPNFGPGSVRNWPARCRIPTYIG